MNEVHRWGLAALACLSLAAAGFGVAACSSSEPNAPSTPIPTPGTGDPAADAGDDSGLAPGECFDTDAGPPTQPVHFLNQCNDGECFKFDNTAQIENYTAGSPLPPLN